MSKYTITQFRKEFPDERSCLDYIFAKKHPNLTGYYFVEGRKCYANSAGKQIHPVAGTIFEKSSTPLTLWFYAIYLFSASRNGVAAKELQRQLGVTYKTAWRMAKQIRSLMSRDGGKLFGTVEVDETYIGGKHLRARGFKDKTAVMGMVERKGRVYARHIPNREKHTLLGEISRNVRKGSTIMTDEWEAYKSAPRLGYKRYAVQHAAKEYVRGKVHTNTIEGFWGQLKRSLDGTYHAVSRKHLQSYVDEFSFRRNHVSDVFGALVARI